MERINKDIFKRRFKQLLEVTRKKSGLEALDLTTLSFESGFWESEEGYKCKIWEDAQQILNLDSWLEQKRNPGYIIKSVINTMVFEDNDGNVQNLVSVPNIEKVLEIFYDNPEKTAEFLFELYHSNCDEKAFTKLAKMLDVRRINDPFSIMAYLLFLKDKEKYVPVRKEGTQKRFRKLGLKTNCLKTCSWLNYMEYLDIVGQLQKLLQDELTTNVTLLDAQSFLWMIDLVDEDTIEYEVSSSQNHRILYDNYVNWSIFDGEVTLNKEAKEHILKTVFNINPQNRDISLIIKDQKYGARLMNVPSSHSVQISYKEDIKVVFREIFDYSYDYWTNIRDEAKKINHSTRRLPGQTVERITIVETDVPFVYQINCQSYFTEDNPFDRQNLEAEENIYFPEGKKVFANHVRYERNQALITLAKEKFKAKNGSLFCEVCGFSFDVYGERGREFIEAHHDVIPVSEMGDDSVSSINDIRMVCSNCHRILHLKRPWLKVEELKQLLTSDNI